VHRHSKALALQRESSKCTEFFLAFFVCLQLSAFSLVTAMSLWINELMYGAIALISTSSTVYHGLFIASTTLLLPWTTMGWIAVRREKQKLMAGFLIMGFFFIVSWAVMFYSLVFRWTFTSWPFFASLTVVGFVDIVVSCTLGVICWRNFDKGLAHYLYAEEILEKDKFQPGVFTNDDGDVEKASFDSDLDMFTVEGTKFVLAANAIHL